MIQTDFTRFLLNFDYLVTDNVMFRLEARTLNSKDIFWKNNDPSNQNVFLTTSLAISF
jgi:hypothetical protein